MKLQHYSYDNEQWDRPLDASLDSSSTLVIIFSTYSAEKVREPLQKMRETYKDALIIGASTAGNIFMDSVEESPFSMTVIKFDTSKIKLVSTHIQDMQNSFESGRYLAKNLKEEDLKFIYVLSNGLHTNGSELVDGFNDVFDSKLPISGALAADDGKFESTWIIANGSIDTNGISAIGFYGDSIHYSSSYKDGLDIFGIQRLVTRSKANVLYELDGKPALEIYKEYLGEQSQRLPLSALSFPLAIETATKENITRTVLAVDEKEKSMTFAGDIPQGSYVSFMKANLNRVVAGANKAAEELHLDTLYDGELLTIAVSCIGRRLILKQRTEEELEAIVEMMPQDSTLIGMYSFGEISPTQNKCCELHNQTMTLMAIWERDA